MLKMHKSVMNLSIVVLVVVTLWSDSVDAAAKKCVMSESDAEACGAQMLILNENMTIPKSEAEILEKCTNIEKGIECYKEYAKTCLDPMASRVMSMVSRNGKKLADRLCKEESSRTELLNHFNCWKSSEDLQKMSICLDKYMIQMQGLANVSNDDRIPTVCCSYHMLKACMKSQGEKTCNKPESVAFIDNMATGITGDLVKFVCGKFKSLEDCDTKMDTNSWQKLKELVASDDPQVIKAMKKYQSPFAALKDMLKKIKN
ncbi:unnamed protein product [Oppiella nova]|uniref:Uncharacterized protein n=1 Tax=Oppiella nova TaxID=334625 RepID=A0A7R9M8S8_9ACAR|nr:unnamed protein product [Oppiella nova]CAG2171785.1 unnamed protein product [Oppiella nova]